MKELKEYINERLNKPVTFRQLHNGDKVYVLDKDGKISEIAINDIIDRPGKDLMYTLESDEYKALYFTRSEAKKVSRVWYDNKDNATLVFTTREEAEQTKKEIDSKYK